MQNMNEPRIFILLGKKLSNEATAEELAELKRLLKDQPVEPYELELLQDIWQKKSGTDESLPDQGWEKISSKLHDQPGAVYEYIPKPKKMFFPAGRMMAAASMAALLALTVWLVWRRQEEKAAPVAVSGVKDSVTVALNGERHACRFDIRLNGFYFIVDPRMDCPGCNTIFNDTVILQ